MTMSFRSVRGRLSLNESIFRMNSSSTSVYQQERFEYRGKSTKRFACNTYPISPFMRHLTGYCDAGVMRFAIRRAQIPGKFTSRSTKNFGLPSYSAKIERIAIT